jgi:ankyrin repeat protein
MLFINRYTAQILKSHPDILFIRSHPKSDIPKYGYPKLLYFCDHLADFVFGIACRYGNIQMAKHTFLEASHSCEIYIIYMIWSSKTDSVEMIKYLISLGFDKTYLARSLTDASKKGHMNRLKYLISIGVDVHVLNDLAIKVAIQYNRLDAARYLVEHGADIHNDTYFCFLQTCMNGHLKMLKYLISVGVRIHDYYKFAVLTASRYGQLNIIRYLVSPDMPLDYSVQLNMNIQDDGSESIINFDEVDGLKIVKRILSTKFTEVQIDKVVDLIKYGNYFEIIEYLREAHL